MPIRTPCSRLLACRPADLICRCEYLGDGRLSLRLQRVAHRAPDADWIWVRRLVGRLKYTTHATTPPCCYAGSKRTLNNMSRIGGPASNIFASTHNQALGRWLLPMLLHWSEWVHRRVTTVSFVNERQFHRHVSIDFTIPIWRASPGYNSSEEAHLVPITLLEKRHDVLRDVNVFNESGASVSILITQEVWAIASVMLQDVFRASLGTSVLTHCQMHHIEQVVCASPDKARAHLQQLTKVLRKVRGDQITEAARLAFSALANDLADNFIMVALVSGQPGQRRIVKFDYEDEARSFHCPRAIWSTTKSSWGRLAERIKNWPSLIAVQVGLTPLPIVLGIRDVAYAKSYHIELPSPDGLYFLRASFDKYEEGKWKPLTDSGPSERAHLYLYNQARDIRTRLTAEFCMQPGDWPTLGFTSAILTFAILIAGVVLHQVFGRHADIGGAAAVLAVLPGVLAAMYLRSGEHPILRWMVRGIRLMVIALMILSLASAGLLVVRPALPSWVWLILTVISFMFVCLMLGTLVRSRRPPSEADDDGIRQGVR